jgi:hypothetical protein
LDRLRSGLKLYQGSHRFHNFTNHKASSDPSVMRHMYSFTASDAFRVPTGSAVAPPGAGEGGGRIEGSGGGGVAAAAAAGEGVEEEVADAGESSASEWVLLEVVGQSFLLHQIRKMVATIVDLARCPPPPTTAVVGEAAVAEPLVADEAVGVNKEDDECMAVVVARALDTNKVSTAMAPSLGLYLDRPFFEDYNRNYTDTTAKISAASSSSSSSGGEARRPLAWDDQNSPAVAGMLAEFKREVRVPPFQVCGT